MKIIFLTREGYNLPGARIRCYNFSQELKKYGLLTEVISFSDTFGAKDGKDEGRMPAREKIKYNLQSLKLLSKEKNAVVIMQRFHYHSFGPYLAHLFRAGKNRLVFDLDDWEMRENPKYYFGLFPSSKAEFLTRQIAKQSSFCIAASHYLKSYLAQFNKNVYYLPSGVDTDLFRSLNGGVDKPERQWFGFPYSQSHKSRTIFSWVGTIHSKEIVENLKFICECFLRLRKKYAHIYLEIAGDGSQIIEFKKIISDQHDSHIIYKGWIPPKDMPEYLSGIDIGLIPLIQDTRFNKAKSPVKLFEYMAMVKPTVSSSIGEIEHIIRDGENGLLAKDKSQFIDRMEKLINDRRLCSQIGEKALQTVKDNYSLSVLGKRLCEILSVFTQKNQDLTNSIISEESNSSMRQAAWAARK